MSVLTKEDRDQLAEHIAKAREIKRRAKAPKVKVSQRERRERDKAIDRSRPEQRKPRVKDNAYLQWVRRQGCCVGPVMGDPCVGRIDPAHIRFTDRKAGRVNPGLQNRSDDKWCLPACRKHHDAQHAYGNEPKWWSVEVGIDPSDYAREHYAAFEAGETNEAVVRRFTPSFRGVCS